MFTGKRYLTRGVNTEIPFELQLFMWSCIDNLKGKKDYFQVFELKNMDGVQVVHHFSEQPEYSQNYLLTTIDHPIEAKVYVIDDEAYSTMLLAEDY